MKPVQLSDNFYARIRTTYGHEVPATGRLVEYRSVRLTVTIFHDDGGCLGTLTGVSYCIPEDQFSKKIGRQIATRRLFEDPQCCELLHPRDYLTLLPILRTGRISQNIKHEVSG